MVNKYFIGLSVLVIATGVVQCKPDYLYYYEAEGWLKLHRTIATWEEAFVTCHDEGAVLASPLTKGLVNSLNVIHSQSDVFGNLLVGVHALFSKGDYISIEGVPLTAMEVGIGGYGEGDCASFRDSRVYRESCKTQLAFVCYKKGENRVLNECGTFDDKYQLNQKTGSCYKVHQDLQTWSRAYRICASEGGHLVVVNDDVEAQVVKDLFPARTNQSEEEDKFSVGLAAFGRDRIWTTIEGADLSDVYNKWVATKGSNNRGAILPNGELVDVSEDRVKQFFVCEKSPKSKRFGGVPPSMEHLEELCSTTEESQTVVN